MDLHRQWVGYGQNGGSKSDLYRITSTSRQGTASRPAPPPASRTRDVNAGPIWNQQDARRKCPAVAASQGGEWTGQWRTTVQGKMSVCEIRF
nr:mannan-binding lectin [Sphingopyxis sp. BSNA05]